MKTLGLLIGILLVPFGLVFVPDALLHFKDEDTGVVLGRLICVGCEITVGGLLIFFCIHRMIRDSKKRRQLLLLRKVISRIRLVRELLVFIGFGF
jgi:hypothetical protein